jgi:Phage integrase family
MGGLNTIYLRFGEMAGSAHCCSEPPTRRSPRRLDQSILLSADEVTPGPKYKAALSAAYAAGLRVSEVVALKVSDVDSERLLLRVEQGKGRKDRYAMLSPKLLELLRDWYRIARPAVWLFPGGDPMLPMSTRQFNRAVHAAAAMAAIKKRVTPHRSFRQAGLRLQTRRECLSLPGRRGTEILLHQGGERAEIRMLLDKCLPRLRLESEMHNGKRAAHLPMGARGCC